MLCSCAWPSLLTRPRAQVNRMVSVTTMMFGDQLRGTMFLVWWYRALVRPRSQRYRVRM